MLATLAADGHARLVPIAYAVDRVDDGPVVYSALDEKPKSLDEPLRLARVRDILARPRVTLLVDRWSEDWSRLAWLRVEGTASILRPAEADVAAEHGRAIALLRARYPQYREHDLETRPLIRIAVARVTGWGL